MAQIEIEKLNALFRHFNVTVFEYFPEEDRLYIYDQDLKSVRETVHLLEYLDGLLAIRTEDRWKLMEFFKGAVRGPVEVRVQEEGQPRVKRLAMSLIGPSSHGPDYVGTINDITQEYEQKNLLEKLAMRDAMTGLYNHDAGMRLIDEYLEKKSPYESCALLLLDIDFFKNVNDSYGHLFGDEVLKCLAAALESIFDKKDILVRAGGDEFVVLLKGIRHVALLKKAETLLRAIRELTFSEREYSMTCSAGICYLPENISGYTYSQLFSNADWALYQAKERGRNCYAFCDTLQRFEKQADVVRAGGDIDARYLHNDIIATAFEIFEKQNSFVAAMELLMKVIGARFRLDRITVIQTDIKENQSSRQYIWMAPGTPDVLETPGSFTKDDFLTLFHSYDEYGTTVLQWDDMEMYSPEAQALLMQGGAKTVVYAAMYVEGRYTGAISYVVCDSKRFWTKLQRSQLGELTKIISAHLARAQALNVRKQSCLALQEFDPLTGLLSFPSFREELERFIVGNFASSHVLAYTDFCNFQSFNQKFGYQAGDQLLKDFAGYIAGYLQDESELYMTRVSSDHFILFKRCGDREASLRMIEEANRSFLQQQKLRYPGHALKTRTGVCFLTGDSTNAAEVIDRASYAREQDGPFPQDVYIGVFDGALNEKRMREAKITEDFATALEGGQFQVYLQPRFSLADRSLTGAEAMIRWKKDHNTLLYPKDFLEQCEENGTVIDLDFFVFEQVAAFLERLKERGQAVPVSVNASARHARNRDTARRYTQIIERHRIDPAQIEIEFTESDMLLYYENVKQMLGELQKVHLATTLDDYGSGFSKLNMMIDAPVNTVKLDRSFLNDCAGSEKGAYYLAQTIQSVKGLGYRAVCEGVETREQAELLRSLGCDEAQGYWFARPMPMEEFEQKLCQGTFRLQRGEDAGIGGKS